MPPPSVPVVRLDLGLPDLEQSRGGSALLADDLRRIRSAGTFAHGLRGVADREFFRAASLALGNDIPPLCQFEDLTFLVLVEFHANLRFPRQVYQSPQEGPVPRSALGSFGTARRTTPPGRR